MVHKKIMLAVVAVIYWQHVCSMENQHSHQIVLSDSPPIPFAAQAFNVGWDFLSSNFASAVVTFQNHVSDEAAFAKLGWPVSDESNQAELKKGLLVQARHSDSIARNTMMNDQFISDAAFLDRRHAFVRRVVDALPYRSDGAELAVFCLKNWQPVMNSFEIGRMIAFLQLKKTSTESITQTLNQELSSLAGMTDSALLRAVLQGGSVNIDIKEGDDQKGK